MHALCKKQSQAKNRDPLKILQFIINMQLDYRISCLLSCFRNEFVESSHSSGGEETPKLFKWHIDVEIISLKADSIVNDQVKWKLDLHLNGQESNTLNSATLDYVRVAFARLRHPPPSLIFGRFSQSPPGLQAGPVSCTSLTATSNLKKQIKADLEGLCLKVEKS